MTVVQINGVGFETAVLWTVDRVDISFTDTQGGSSTVTASVYDPGGPNAGNDTPGMVIDTWTDALIEVSFDANDFDQYVTDVSIWDASLSYSAGFDVSPDAPTEITPPLPTITSVQEDYGNNVRGDLEIIGTNLSGHGHVVVYYNFGASSLGFTNPPGGPTSLILENPILAGQTITSIEIYESYPNTNLLLSFSGGNLPFAMSDYPYRFSYNSMSDELIITLTNNAFDFNDIDYINYQSNGSGQLNTSHWVVNSSYELVILNATLMLNSGPVTDLSFVDGVTTVGSWSDSNPIQGYPSPIYLV